MQRKGAAALVVALALGLASCGGSGTTTTARRFAHSEADANAICLHMGKQIAALQKASTPATMRRNLLKAAEVIDEGLVKLDALVPPTALQGHYEQLKALLRGRGEAARALSKPHPHLSARATRAIEPHTPQPRLAQALHLPACG